MTLQVRSSAAARTRTSPAAARVSRWMTRPVITVRPRDTLRTARSLMAEHRINQLPVVRNGKLAGMVTDRDLRDAYPSSVLVYPGKDVDAFADACTIEEVMTYGVVAIRPDASILEAAALLRRHRIGALPVVEQGRLAGILTRSDILDFLLGRKP